MKNNSPAKGERKKPIGAKKILLWVFGSLSALMILLSSVVLLNLLFAKNIKVGMLTDSLDDFVTLYKEAGNASMLPRGLEITGSDCTIGQDGKTFRYRLGIKNTFPADQELAYQLYFNEDYEKTYGKNSGNPMIRVNEEAPQLIEAGKTCEIVVNGVILGRDGGAAETFKEKMATIYAELCIDGEVGRILLPVNFS